MKSDQTSMRSQILVAGVTVCALTVAAGWVEGRLSNRWGPPAELAQAGARLATVPERIGEWEMRSSQPLDAEIEQMLQCAGSITRVYVNSRTGDTVSVALLVGPPGPTAAHTPEVCYSSVGKKISEPSQAVQTRPVDMPDETLWRMTFRSTDAEGQLLRVFYGWRGPDGPWRAANDPRFEYGGQPMLYKIQLASLMSERPQESGHDSCHEFLHDFLPALDESLF
jgi:Protein of unknown function (DUF3485)